MGEALANSACGEEIKRTVLLSGLEFTTTADQQVARALVAHLNQSLGADWIEGLLTQVRDNAGSSDAVLLIMLALPSTRLAWNSVAAYGSALEENYWKQTQVYMNELTDTDLPFVLRKLIQVDRPYAAAQIAVQRLKQTGAELLIEILRALATTTNAPHPGNDVQMLAYYLEQILGSLDQSAELDQDEIARLEWIFLPLLRHSQRGLTSLHKAMSREPALFVEVLSALYGPDGDDGDEAEPASEVDAARSRAHAERAYQLLNSWHLLPGQQGQQVDGEKLTAWVQSARRLCKDAKRAIIGDVYIGKMLAHAPNGQDGFWPVEPVRKLIELMRCKEMENGIETGLHNKRGVTVRAPRDGGSLERAEAVRYEDAARAQRALWPRTSKILARVAASYQAQAKSMDEDVERREWY